MPAGQELKVRHREVMGESLMDMLRALATPNMDIRKKTLDIALDLITSRNIDEARSAHLGLACLAASRVSMLINLVACSLQPEQSS